MPIRYSVEEQDCINRIAEQHGLLPETIREAAENAERRELREDPNVLMAGDVVVIPDIEEKWHEAQSNKRHSFRRKGALTRISFRLIDQDDQPRKDVPYLVEIDLETFSGKTDGEGMIDFAVPPGGKRAVLEISDEERYELQIGGLDPVTEANGVRQRLFNLGYIVEEADEDELEIGIIAFKREHCDLELDAEDLFIAEEEELTKLSRTDQAFRDKLLEVHGS